MEKTQDVTREKFKTYEAIRQSGVTNMFDVKTVVQLSDGILNRADCFSIMQQYTSLKARYVGRESA